jgi:hypothetical protein
LARNTGKKDLRSPQQDVDTTSATFVARDVLSLSLEPTDTPLVIGQRGLAELLGDLAVATDDLSS